jgi:hypothetical protein
MSAPDRRYQKRMAAYWARAQRSSFKALDLIDISSWFDFWHAHLDWKGRGNRFPTDRMSVVRLTYELLRYAEVKAGGRLKPLQVWATVCGDTGENAVYIHTENPNGTPFPYSFEGVQWGVDLPSGLGEIIDRATHEIGQAVYPEETVYFIRAKSGARP